MNILDNGKLYRLRNVAFNGLLNVYAGKSDDGTNVCLWGHDNSTEQKWMVSSDNPAGVCMLYTAVSEYSVLDFFTGGINFGNADIWSHNDDENQALFITGESNGAFKIELLQRPKYVLTATGAENNSNVKWALDTEGAAQRWYFDEISPIIKEGLDTAAKCNTTELTNAIAKSKFNYEFIGRYYCANRNAGKIITKDEADKLHASGLSIVSIYQDANNSPDHFSFDIGVDDAQNALEYAIAVMSQPENSAIYFAVDFNPNQQIIEQNIIPYFNGVRSVFEKATVAYRIGVYGSGLVCQKIKQDTHLADLSWLAQSSAYYGTAVYNDPKKYDIRQGCNVKLGGIVFDSNASGINSNFGQW